MKLCEMKDRSSLIYSIVSRRQTLSVDSGRSVKQRFKDHMEAVIGSKMEHQSVDFEKQLEELTEKQLKELWANVKNIMP